MKNWPRDMARLVLQQFVLQNTKLSRVFFDLTKCRARHTYGN